MAVLLRNRRIVSDGWQSLEPRRWLQVGEDGLVPDFPAAADLIITPRLWALRREDLLERSGRLGLRLEPEDDPGAFAAELGHFALLAVNFPKFGDGRGFSIARLLRERYGYQGELRALGQVTRDHLFFMDSCGFDSFALRECEDPEEALSGFGDFSEAYQACVARPQPLFRRRLRA
ncbi:MAG: DUF934 domain-containing protein [Betaproteobacteria bacterium]|nr:DUF934 domain-containing protein [Betaproteobacteria bacterium]